MASKDGKLVAIAFDAVKQCHKDVGVLIHDLDSHMQTEGFGRLWDTGNDTVVHGLSYSPTASFWMAKRLYRLFKNTEVASNTVDGINIRFFANHPAIQEPTLLIGRTSYEVAEGRRLSEVAAMWDLEDAFGKWNDTTLNDIGTIRVFENLDGGRITRMTLAAVDLYRIHAFDEVVEYLNRVRDEFGS